MLHKLLMFDLFPPLVVALDLVLQSFHTITFVAVLLEFFSSEVVAVEKLLLEEAHGLIILFKTL